MSRLIKRKIEEIWPNKYKLNIVLFAPNQKSNDILNFIKNSVHNYWVLSNSNYLTELTNVELLNPEKLIHEIKYQPDITLDFSPYESTERHLSISQQFMLEHCFVHTYIPQVKKEAILKMSHVINMYPNYITNVGFYKDLFIDKAELLQNLTDDRLSNLAQNNL